MRLVRATALFGQTLQRQRRFGLSLVATPRRSPALTLRTIIKEWIRWEFSLRSTPNLLACNK